MWKIAVCENNYFISGIYQNSLLLLSEKYNLNIKVTIYHNEDEFLFEMEQAGFCEYSIVILNSQYKRNSGIEVMSILRKGGYKGEVIFLSVDKRRVFESFLVKPFFYLVEHETSRKKFEEVILKCLVHHMEEEKKMLIISKGKSLLKVRFQEIQLIYIEHRVAKVQGMNNELGNIYESLNDIEKKLSWRKEFIRVHRGYIVNMEFIDVIGKDHLIMSNGNEIPIGKKYKKQLIESIMEYESIS